MQAELHELCIRPAIFRPSLIWRVSKLNGAMQTDGVKPATQQDSRLSGA
jgi:hypothetical protein